MLMEQIFFLSFETANCTVFFSSKTKLKSVIINQENMSKFGVQGPDLKLIPQYRTAINANAYQSTRLTKKLLSTAGIVIYYYFELSASYTKLFSIL